LTLIGGGSIGAGQKLLQKHLDSHVEALDESVISLNSYIEEIVTHNGDKLIIAVRVKKTEAGMMWALLDCTHLNSMQRFTMKANREGNSPPEDSSMSDESSGFGLDFIAFDPHTYYERPRPR